MEELLAKYWPYIVAAAPVAVAIGWKFFKKRAAKSKATWDDDLVESVEEVTGDK